MLGRRRPYQLGRRGRCWPQFHPWQGLGVHTRHSGTCSCPCRQKDCSQTDKQSPIYTGCWLAGYTHLCCPSARCAAGASNPGRCQCSEPSCSGGARRWCTVHIAWPPTQFSIRQVPPSIALTPSQLRAPIVAAPVERLIVDCHSGHSLLQVVERDRLPEGATTMRDVHEDGRGQQVAAVDKLKSNRVGRRRLRTVRDAGNLPAPSKHKSA